MTSRRREAQTLLVIVLVALVACGGPVDPEGPSGEDVVVTDEAVVVTLPSGGTVTIPPVAAGETAVVTVAESTLPFTGEFAPLEWLTAAVSLTTEDDAAWTEDAIVHLSLPLRGSAALSTQAFEVTSAGRVDGRSHGAYGARGTGDQLVDPRNVGLMTVRHGFETATSGAGCNVDTDGLVVSHHANGITESGGHYPSRGHWRPQRNAGLRWLTTYTDADAEHVSRPKTAPLTWEQTTTSPTAIARSRSTAAE